MDAPRVLRQARLRVTNARVAVLDALSEAGAPLSHKQFSSLPGIANLDRVTLYRTLEVLEERGIVDRLLGVDGAARFVLHRGTEGCPGNHPHFLCRACAGMSCLPGPEIPFVDVPPGTEVQAKQLLLLGLCPDCASARGER
jgi:Fur family ferric uptake transcriptional regulator